MPRLPRLAHWLATANCFVTVGTAVVTLPFEVWFHIGRLTTSSALRFSALPAPFSAAASATLVLAASMARLWCLEIRLLLQLVEI
jgi:hypothetical protein